MALNGEPIGANLKRGPIIRVVPEDQLWSALNVAVDKVGMFVLFLDASSHLYKRVCPSVRQSVRPSVRRSVRNAFVKSDKNEYFSP